MSRGDRQSSHTGRRLRQPVAEETEVRPKPLVEIGGRPILWHIMQIYSHFGLHDLVICLGYKGYMIKEYLTCRTIRPLFTTTVQSHGVSR